MAVTLCGLNEQRELIGLCLHVCHLPDKHISENLAKHIKIVVTTGLNSKYLMSIVLLSGTRCDVFLTGTRVGYPVPTQDPTRVPGSNIFAEVNSLSVIEPLYNHEKIPNNVF